MSGFLNAIGRGFKKFFALDIADKKSKGETIFLWILFAIFVVYSVTLFYPLYWCIISALKSAREFPRNIYGLPKEYMWSNFLAAFEVKLFDYNIFDMFLNSVFLTTVIIIVALLECTMCAYVFSMYKFPGSKSIYNFILLTMMIPLAGSTPALYRFFVQTGLYDTRLGYILIFTGGFGGPFMLMYNYYETMTWTYGEAAMIDGANDWRIFFTIMLPQSAGMMFVIAMQSFMGIYGDFTNALLYLKTKPTLTVGITTLTTNLQGTGDYPTAFAAMLLTCIPTWIFYTFSTDKIFKIRLGSGVKG